MKCVMKEADTECGSFLIPIWGEERQPFCFLPDFGKVGEVYFRYCQMFDLFINISYAYIAAIPQNFKSHL